MDKIEEKDIETLKQNGKKFKFSIKKTIAGIMISTIIVSGLPHLQYKVALYKAQNDTYISQLLESNIDKKDKIAQIYEKAINNNKNIPQELKEKLIRSFIDLVIDVYGDFFDDKTIYNMYAVASTEKITEISDFAKEHGWYRGDYNPYTNTISLEDTIEDCSEILIAHEQLHAILKSGLLSSGLANRFTWICIK